MTKRSGHRRKLALPVVLASAVALFALPLSAAPIVDPAGDFIPTFTGTPDGDLDVLSVSAIYDGTAFHISAVESGPIGTTATSLFVWGFDRGQGTPRFASIGVTGVLFDSVVTLTGGGLATVRDLISGAATVLPSSDVHIAGNTFSIDVPVSLLPSEGFAPENYGINLWPRDPRAAGNGQISDFAPDNAVFIADLPEPASLGLFAAAAGVIGIVRRRRLRA